MPTALDLDLLESRPTLLPVVTPSPSRGEAEGYPRVGHGRCIGPPIGSRVREAGAQEYGTLALVGGGEWRDGCRDLDAELLAASGAKEVVVLPTAAAFEHPDQVRRSGRRRTSSRSGSRCRDACRSCTAPRPTTPKIAETVRRARSSTSPTARRCTCARCSRTPRCSTRCSPRTTAARRSPRRARAPRSSATRWSIPAAARTRSGSAWSPTSRCSRTTAPPPTTCASARSTSCRGGEARGHRRGDRARPRSRRHVARRRRRRGHPLRGPHDHRARLGNRSVAELRS